MKNLLLAAIECLIVFYLPAQNTVSSAVSDDNHLDYSDSIDSECPDSIEWEELSMQGKLHFDGLPLDPTVKIYMKRGESIIMSARAPIFGEVARMEICSDSLTLINKHSRKFCSVNLKKITGENPGIVTDFQDVLLGEIAYPGHGPLTPDLLELTEQIETANKSVFLYPEKSLQFNGMEYGFIVDPDDFQLQTFAMFVNATNSVAQLDYKYGNEGWTLGITFELNKRPLSGELRLSYPDYDASPLTFTNAGARYTRTDLSGLLKF